MSPSSITQEIMRQVEALPPAQQQAVLDFARALARPAGRPGRDVLHLAGTIDAADLEIMRQVADEDSEHIDQHGW